MTQIFSQKVVKHVKKERKKVFKKQLFYKNRDIKNGIKGKFNTKVFAI